MTTVVKSSENENKVIAVTLKRPCKSGRNHGKVHENGRGEVHSPSSGDVSHNQISFLNEYNEKDENSTETIGCHL